MLLMMKCHKDHAEQLVTKIAESALLSMHFCTQGQTECMVAGTQ
jgi:hypothetical protein